MSKKRRITDFVIDYDNVFVNPAFEGNDEMESGDQATLDEKNEDIPSNDITELNCVTENIADETKRNNETPTEKIKEIDHKGEKIVRNVNDLGSHDEIAESKKKEV